MGFIIISGLALLFLASKSKATAQAMAYSSSQQSLMTPPMPVSGFSRPTGAAPVGQPTKAGADAPISAQTLNPMTPQVLSGLTAGAYAPPPTGAFVSDNGAQAFVATSDATLITFYDTNGEVLGAFSLAQGQTAGISYSSGKQCAYAQLAGPGGSTTAINYFVKDMAACFQTDGGGKVFQDETAPYPAPTNDSSFFPTYTPKQIAEAAAGGYQLL